MELTEKQIEKMILQYLFLLPNCFAWKEDGQGVVVGTGSNKRMLKISGRYRVKGKSDILGIYNGKFIAIEVKKPGGRVSKDQENFIAAIKAVGGHGCVAYSLDDARKFIQDVEKSMET